MGCDLVYQHSQLDSTFKFDICFDEYETKLMLLSDSNNVVIVAMDGGDGTDFWEIKSKFIDSFKFEKIYWEGRYNRMTTPDTIFVDKKIVSVIELKKNGGIIETRKDSVFSYFELIK